MDRPHIHIIRAEDEDMRLDRWFAKHFPDLSHAALEKLLRTGQIRLEGGRTKANIRIERGQKLRVPPLRLKTPAKKAKASISKEAIEKLHNAILHKDEHLIAINKWAGLAVQGGSKVGLHLDAMLDELRFGAGERPRLIHRLDRETSGLLLLARSRKTADYMTKLFSSRKIEKLYWGLTYGVPRPAKGMCQLPLIKRLIGKVERIIIAEKNEQDAQKAVTLYSMIAHAGQHMAWLAFQPRTGRKHQIRVHAAALDIPLVGDNKYGSKEPPGGEIGEGLHLHARTLRFPHPAGGMVEITAPLQGGMAQSWKVLGFADDAENPFQEMHI